MLKYVSGVISYDKTSYDIPSNGRYAGAYGFRTQLSRADSKVYALDFACATAEVSNDTVDVWVKVWGVDSNGTRRLRSVSKNPQRHARNAILHYELAPFEWQSDDVSCIVSFHTETTLDATTFSTDAAKCVAAVQLDKSGINLGGVIQNSDGSIASSTTGWTVPRTWYLAPPVEEQPVTIMLRATKEYSVSNGPDATWTWRYATHIPDTSMADLIDNAQIAEGKPILTPLCIFDYSSVGNTPVFGGYMVTLPRKNADIMAAKWATLVANSGVNAVPDVTYLS
jgi:hypothetical protein